MAKKSDKPEPSAELQELEQKVDAMMSTEKPAAAVQLPKAAAKKSSLKVISSYAGSPQTAPELSPKLLKTVKAGKASASKSAAKVTAAPAAPDQVEPAEDTPPEPEAVVETPQPEEADETPAPAAEVPSRSIIDDAETDKAVADIVVHEGDTQLAVEDAITRRKTDAVEEPRPTTSGYWLFLLFIIVIGTAAVAYLWFR